MAWRDLRTSSSGLVSRPRILAITFERVCLSITSVIRLKWGFRFVVSTWRGHELFRYDGIEKRGMP